MSSNQGRDDDETYILKPQHGGGTQGVGAGGAGEYDPTKIIKRQPSTGGATDNSETHIIRPGAKPTQAASTPNVDVQPVVGWLVILRGPGQGSHRAIFNGNNSVGRDVTQRIPINFGDSAISAEEQAYIQYDFESREFYLVPNMAKSNIVSVNSTKLVSPVQLSYADTIEMGQTVMRFVPLCGPDFDWSDELGTDTIEK